MASMAFSFGVSGKRLGLGLCASFLSFNPALNAAWATSSQATRLPTVTIGKAVDNIPFTALDVGLAEGFFKKNGVNVKEILVSGSSAASAAMVGGSLQFAFEGAVPLMLARSRGVPLIAVDGLDDGITLQFLASKTWLAKHPAPANATLKQKMADLNGSTFGRVSVTDSAFYALVRSWAGLPKTTGYRTESMDSEAAATVALQKGIVDVVVESPPHCIQLTQGGDAVEFVDRKDVPQFKDVVEALLTTTDSYAKKDPKIVKAVATAVAESVDFMRDHPKQTLAIEEKHYPNLDKSVLRESLKFIPFTKNGLQSQRDWDRTVTLAQETGFVKGVEAAPEGVFWTNKYIDRSKL